MQLVLLIVAVAFSSSCYGGIYKVGEEPPPSGGEREEDATSPKYMKMAWKAVKTVAEQADATRKAYLIPVEIRKAVSLLVAGVMYTLEVVYGESTCEKDKVAVDAMTQANCQLKKNPMKALYKVEVWSKPWENFEQYTVTKIRDV